MVILLTVEDFKPDLTKIMEIRPVQLLIFKFGKTQKEILKARLTPGKSATTLPKLKSEPVNKLQLPSNNHLL